MTITDTAPRAWVGCLACYNGGRLTGEWVDAVDAADVTPEDLHGGRPTDHEELWCFDTDGLPLAQEMDPTTAARWGELYDEVGAQQWPAFCTWVRGGAYVEDGDGMPSVSDFADRYRGQWASFREYAYDLIDSTGMQRDWPQVAITYFDVDAWADDIRQGYTIEDAPDRGIFLFLNI